jgi:hypothetical protein
MVQDFEGVEQPIIIGMYKQVDLKDNTTLGEGFFVQQPGEDLVTGDTKYVSKEGLSGVLPGEGLIELYTDRRVIVDRDTKSSTTYSSFVGDVTDLL